MPHTMINQERLRSEARERDEASQTVLLLLVHIHELAEEAGLSDMAAAIGRAKLHCLALRASQSRPGLDAGAMTGSLQ